MCVLLMCVCVCEWLMCIINVILMCVILLVLIMTINNINSNNV